MAGRRPERVAHLVQAELARLLLEEAKNPRLHEVIVTLVRMTPDLRVARIYFRTLSGGATRADVARALERAAPFLRTEISHVLGLRVTPELRFAYDDVPDTADRVDALLRGPARPREDEEA
ncbi:MAG: 30S ribosome-binding factor RbfA [Deltaproteobacteria bacterium]|nr:MAG: 30S ribosome-binding factor RbfA [Deltaproteobacteria bacterium]